MPPARLHSVDIDKIPWRNPKTTRFLGIVLQAYFWVILSAGLAVSDEGRNMGGTAYSIVQRHGFSGLSTMLWVCNVALLASSFGMIFRKRSWIGASIVLTLVYDIAFAVDCIAIAVNGTTLSGMAGYLDVCSENAGWTTWLTSLHHVWFIPLCLAQLYGNGGIDGRSLMHGIAGQSVLIFLCRFLTPVAQNVNFSHHIPDSYEYWSHGKEYLHYFDPPREFAWKTWLLYFYVLITLLSVLDGISFVMLRAIFRGGGWEMEEEGGTRRRWKRDKKKQE